jgi:uncharacterized protein (DUF362 family)
MNAIQAIPVLLRRMPAWAVLLLCGAAGVLAEDASPPPAPPPATARVVRATDPQKMRFFTPDARRVGQLLTAGMLKLTGTADGASAWRKIVAPTDRVGIRIQTANGAVMETRPAVVEAVIDGLVSAGVPRKQIIVFDRYGPQMEDVGYTLGQRADGVTMTATIPLVGYDPDVFVDCGLPGKLIWGDYEFKGSGLEADDQLSTKSYFSRIVTQQVDKIINIPVLTTDPHYGLSGCLLGSALTIVDNDRRFNRGGLIRDDALARLFSTPVVQKKYVLHILDALIAQYVGGPEFDPTVCQTLQTLFISRDPVAIDALALRWINEQRPKIKVAPIGDESSYIEAAATAGLGVNAIDRIKVQDVTVDR